MTHMYTQSDLLEPTTTAKAMYQLFFSHSLMEFSDKLAKIFCGYKTGHKLVRPHCH